MKLTIKDIAKKSGHSCSTVSRVLNDSPFVSEKTRARVKKVIEDMDFRPNHVARGLVKGQMNIVVCIIGDRWNPFYAELFSAAEEVLNREGFLAVLCYTNYEPVKEEKYLEAALENNFAGVIMVTAPETQQLAENLAKLDCPVVLANRYLASVPTDVVLMDNYHGGYIATRHLIDLGHRRIAHWAGPDNSTASRDRVRGYREAMREAGLEVREGDILKGNLLESEGYQFACELLNNPRDVTAVFCGNDMMASGVVRAYSEHGKRIPQDMSVIGFDDSPVAVSGPVKLTTVRQHPEAMGQTAADLVLNRMTNKDQPHRKVVFSPELVVRDSAAPCRSCQPPAAE
ncbi:MAG: LacI family DNA-binding transcriptional regulator [Negativicutes bacterium]|nr:LacI family DNA-binding transcriptional regulator [Negativicutes bacterium]